MDSEKMKQHGTRAERYLQDQRAEIEYIYRTRFPEDRVRIYFYKSDNPFWAAPSIVYGDLALDAEMSNLDYLGMTELVGLSPNAQNITVQISVPRLITSEEMSEDAHQWRPSKWLHSAVVFGISPTLFEQAKYKREQDWWRNVKRAHTWRKLDRSRNTVKSKPTLEKAQKKPAILIGFHWLETGGAEKLAFDSVKIALAAGLRVFVISDLSGPQRLSHKLPKSADVHFVRVDRFLDKGQWPQFIENLIQVENITHIHIHHCTGLYEVLPHVKGKFPEVKVIDSTHIIEYYDGGYPRISGVWANYIDICHVISLELERFFSTEFRVGKKVRLGRLIVKPSEIQAPVPLRAKVAQSKYRVAFVGRMTHQKRPFLVAQIMQKLAKWANKSNSSIEFDIVGEGPYRSAFEKLLKKRDLMSVTTLHPAQTDVPKILGRTDFLILPSSNEGLALVCYEAIEQGAIPISCDVGAQDELMPKELLVSSSPRKCVSETVSIIQRLTEDSGFLEKCKRSVSDRYQEIYSDPTAEDVLMEIYQDSVVGK